ncbi:MAG: hypothetical protein ACRD0U_12905 [Acidimicrobiales bacterium]
MAPVGDLMATVTRRDLDPDALVALEDQRDFLRASLADLDREYDAGDLDATDYATLALDYRRRLDAVEGAISDGKARFAAAKPRRSPLWYVGVTAAVVLFAVIAGVLVARAAGRRDPGQQITGADLRAEARRALDDCLAAEAGTEPSAIVDCYQTAIDRYPDNIDLFANYGWFLARYGREQSSDDLVVTGANFVERAVELAPERVDLRAWHVVVLYWSGRLDDARQALAAFDALDPPLQMRQLIGQIRPDIEAPDPAAPAP